MPLMLRLSTPSLSSKAIGNVRGLLGEHHGGYMAGVHRLLLTLASSSALYSSLVPALGLGGITLHSALNQPLEAEIQLIEVGELSADEVRVRLGSEADFVRAGVERIFFLNDLRFTPLFKGNRSVIRVTSSKAIREPYLNFVVALARPGGQLVREYTLLIDPPSSSAYRRVAELPSYAAPTIGKARSATRPVPATTQGNSYRVVAGDSLWLIAKRLMPSYAQSSQPALMEDLQALNPQAFIAGDSSRLRLGVDLALPDRVAAVEVKPVSAAIAASVPAAQTTDASNQVQGSDLAAPASAADIAQAQQRVDAELAAHSLENRQLQSSILALQTQLTALQEQVQAKDQQLELLRADLAQNREHDVPPRAALPLAVTPPAVAVTTDPQGTWWWLLGGAGILFVTLGALFWRAGGRNRVAAVAAPELPAVSRAPVINTPAVKAAVAPAAVMAAPISTELNRSVSAPLQTSQVTADPLEGANIYIAYGRFSEALGILRKGVEAEPQRLQLRLRMLEVLGELGDSAGFTQEEAILRQQGVDSAQLNQLWTRFAHVLVAEPSVVLNEGAVLLDEQPLSEPEPSPLLADDFHLNLEDLSLDANWDSLSPFETAPNTRNKTELMAVANDPAFRSDLQHLPEVSELNLAQNALSPFADWPANPVEPEPVVELSKSSGSPALASLEHLAASRENLVKLNKALAYIAQGNLGSACSILNEVISAGDAQQQQQARELLAKIA
jgi:pilus assembly protein FimV